MEDASHTAHLDAPAVKIGYYWSRTDRLWIVQALDAEGNQVGAADYAANKANLRFTLEYMKGLHNVTEVEKLQ